MTRTMANNPEPMSDERLAELSATSLGSLTHDEIVELFEEVARMREDVALSRAELLIDPVEATEQARAIIERLDAAEKVISGIQLEVVGHDLTCCCTTCVDIRAWQALVTKEASRG